MIQDISNSNDPINKLFRLDDRVAFVTGAAGHLGSSFATALCEAGAEVILNGRNVEKLEQLAKQLQAKGYKASVSAFDITQESARQENLEKIERDYKRLDIIVNNAYKGSAGTVQSATVKDFEEAYEICVIAAFHFIQLALPLLKETALYNPGGTSIINIASMYGTISPDPSIYGNSGQNNPPYYGAAKAALIQLTRYTACHLAPFNIRVNSISPGAFPSSKIEDSDPLFHDKLSQKNPMNRIGLPDELKGALLFLASDASSYVTGINLPVDGGWTAW